VRVAWRKT